MKFSRNGNAMSAVKMTKLLAKDAIPAATVVSTLTIRLIAKLYT